MKVPGGYSEERAVPNAALLQSLERIAREEEKDRER